jgi:hypothetical protein
VFFYFLLYEENQMLDKDNPFLLRRIRWIDAQGRRCTGICETKDLEIELQKLKDQGIQKTEVSKLTWVPAEP